MEPGAAKSLAHTDPSLLPTPGTPGPHAASAPTRLEMPADSGNPTKPPLTPRLLGNPFNESLPQETHSPTLSDSQVRGKATNIYSNTGANRKLPQHTQTSDTWGCWFNHPACSQHLSPCDRSRRQEKNSIYEPTHQSICIAQERLHKAVASHSSNTQNPAGCSRRLSGHQATPWTMEAVPELW